MHEKTSTPVVKRTPCTGKSQFEWQVISDNTNALIENKKIGVKINRYDILDDKNNILYDTISIVEPSEGCVAIIKKCNKIGLIFEWRPVPSKWFWACPRGFGELNDKDVIEAAIREVKEELGQCSILRAESLGLVHQNTTFYERPTHIVLVEIGNFNKITPSLKEGIVGFSLYSEKEVLDMVQRGDIECQFTLSALMKYFSVYGIKKD